MHVVLIGLMGSGKSTVGGALAARLARPFLDNDAMLERRTGRRARDIAAAEGVDRLHEAESGVLVDALSDPSPAVIAAAAAAPMMQSALRYDAVVYLHAASNVLASRLRVAASEDHRPVLAPDLETMLAEQYAARDPAYRALADVMVDATQVPAAVVDEITRWLETART